MTRPSRKTEFLQEVLLASSIHAAFQRAVIYAPAATENDKLTLRHELKSQLREISRDYSKVISERQHVKNIVSLADDMSAQYGAFLKPHRFRFGIAQKALNVYLKLLWCAGRIPMPPHCPFDRIIIGKLPPGARIPWTRIEHEDEYMELVAQAKIVAKGVPLAEWELQMYQIAE